tara:strand:- start:748 stop:1773 length:1026 start_codon:yes stop_codon:yes gene_type:complete
MKVLIIITIILLSNKYVYSNNLFDTSIHDVNFISNNIENTKIIKINEIKKKSLLNILKKTLSNEKYDELLTYLSDDLINSFIKNVIINDEKIISNKYFSRIKINFNKKKIVEFYRKKNIPYVEYYPEKFLLIIYEEDEISENLFTKNNNFYFYYNQNIETNSLFKIPNLDINDRFILKKEHIKNRDYEKISKFSKKYKLEEIIIVIAKSNSKKTSFELILFSEEKIIEKKFLLNQHEYETFFKILKSETLNIWKIINSIQNNSINMINCKINYFNNLELKEIRKNLNNISIIQNLNIKSLSFKNIEYDIYFYGNLKILNNIFKMNKLDLNESKNQCVIRLK